MYNRKKGLLGTCFLIFSLILTGPASVRAENQNITEEITTAETSSDDAASQEIIPRLAESVTLTPKSTYYLDFRRVGSKTKIQIVSDDSAIVKVNSKGKLIPEKCGTTTVHVTWKEEDVTQDAAITVHVKYDCYRNVTNYGTPIKKSSSKSDSADLYFHRELAEGKSTKINLKNIEYDSIIRYSSTKPDVASVDSNGIILAKSAGTTTIRTTVVQNEKIYQFYEVIHVKENKNSSQKITSAERNAWFSDSGFIGSSIGVGQKKYFESQGDGYLGNPTMLVRGCYSFINDSGSSTDYKITYKGTPYNARTAVRLSGVKKVFINMGMNDLWESPKGVYKRYVSYLSGIRKDSPGIVIFIESTTPVTAGHEQNHLSNKNVDQLNKLMKDYCDSHKDTYYIDVNSCLKDSNGCLKADYCSDNYVHLNMAGYKEWMNALCSYTDQLMIKQQKAEDAVKTAEESLNKSDYDSAAKIVNKLEKSTVRDQLNARLKKIKSKTAQSDLKKASASSEADDISEPAESGETTENTDPSSGEDITQNPDSIGEEISAGDNEISEEEPEKEPTPLKAVNIKTITAKGNTSLKLSWSKNKEAGYYKIYRSTTKSGKYKLAGGTKKTTWIDKKCKKNTKYYYKVRACISKSDDERNSDLSKAAAGHTSNIPKTVVFAGDSVMEGLSAYGAVKEIHTPGKKYVIAHKGLGTLSFQTNSVFRGMTGVDKVISYHPDRLYLMLGMNEISYRSIDDMTENYTEIIEQIKDESPQTEIVILAVSPVSQNVLSSRKGFSKIPKWNEKVKKLAEKYDCRYLDYTSIMKDSKGYLKYNGGDGIHWTKNGYLAFADKIERYEKKINK